MEKTYRNKYLKAVTFSFDDGVNNDIKVVNLLNKYGLKATFNINTGKASHDDKWIFEGKEVYHLTLEEMKNYYKGHEIASHSFSHPHIEKLTHQEKNEEIKKDLFNIEHNFQQKVKGFISPYGVRDDDLFLVMKENNILFGRGVFNTHKFDIPKNLLDYQPSLRMFEKDFDKVVDEFIKLKPTKKQVLFIWTHSYEINTKERWDEFENLLIKLSKQKDIYFCANSEALL